MTEPPLGPLPYLCVSRDIEDTPNNLKSRFHYLKMVI